MNLYTWNPPDPAVVPKAKALCYKQLSVLRKCVGHQAVEPAGREAVLLESSLLLTHLPTCGPKWHDWVGKLLC